MGSTVFPAPSAAGKTMFRTTLTSGTSYTVPAGVTYLNVTLVGGGGGGGGGWWNGGYNMNGESGHGGQIVSSTLSATAGASIAYAIGAGGTGTTSHNNDNATAGGTTTFTGATSALGGNKGNGTGAAGTVGTNYMSANNGGNNGSSGGDAVGGAGGTGCIYVEYWAQEITMRTFAVIENNTVVNIIVGVEDEVVAANPGKYIDYTDGWDYNNGIDGGIYFPVPEVEIS